MNEKKARHWEKLIAGEQIQRSEAETQNGRLDFRGLVLPDVSLTRAVSSGSSRFALAVGLIKLQGLVWDGIDLTGSSLEHLRFYDCEIVNCLFDHSNCCDWRMWRTSFRNCSFRCADLRDAALGAVLSGKRNVFSDVDFSEANLSGTGHTSAEFSRCLFINTKLKKVDFQGSVFTDCIFEGELDEVLFYDLGFNAKDLSPNELLRTDFGKAKFRHVEFRHLDLDTVRLPVSDDHIVLKEDFPRALERILTSLRGRTDTPSRALMAVLGTKQKWLGPNQRRGVFSKTDILSAGGQQGLDLVLNVTKDLK